MEQLLTDIVQVIATYVGQTAAFAAIAVSLVQMLKIFPTVAKKPRQVELLIQLLLFAFATFVRRYMGYELDINSVVPFFEAASIFGQQLLALFAPGLLVLLAANTVAPIAFDKMHALGTPGFENCQLKSETRDTT